MVEVALRPIGAPSALSSARRRSSANCSRARRRVNSLSCASSSVQCSRRHRLRQVTLHGLQLARGEPRRQLVEQPLDDVDLGLVDRSVDPCRGAQHLGQGEVERLAEVGATPACCRSRSASRRGQSRTSTGWAALAYRVPWILLGDQLVSRNLQGRTPRPPRLPRPNELSAAHRRVTMSPDSMCDAIKPPEYTPAGHPVQPGDRTPRSKDGAISRSVRVKNPEKAQRPAPRGRPLRQASMTRVHTLPVFPLRSALPTANYTSMCS